MFLRAQETRSLGEKRFCYTSPHGLGGGACGGRCIRFAKGEAFMPPPVWSAPPTMPGGAGAIVGPPAGPIIPRAESGAPSDSGRGPPKGPPGGPPMTPGMP
mmetsp:Transcript_29372/g.55015  ORF Transcript_29372/g.55015 Transcript_29372/m.55015 type:complete len:101 (+) Transcript_29372:29-331(+)